MNSLRCLTIWALCCFPVSLHDYTLPKAWKEVACASLEGAIVPVVLAMHTDLPVRHCVWGPKSGRKPVHEGAVCNRSMSMQGALAKHNIEPSTQAVRKEDFIEALTKEFHYAPILHCSSDASGSYIDEVRDKSYTLSLTSLAERAQGVVQQRIPHQAAGDRTRIRHRAV